MRINHLHIPHKKEKLQPMFVMAMKTFPNTLPHRQKKARELFGKSWAPFSKKLPMIFSKPPHEFFSKKTDFYSDSVNLFQIVDVVLLASVFWYSLIFS